MRLADFVKDMYSRDLEGLELECSERVEAISAPLGLYEWKCSDGQVFYKSLSALAHEKGIASRKLAETA